MERGSHAAEVIFGELRHACILYNALKMVRRIEQEISGVAAGELHVHRGVVKHADIHSVVGDTFQMDPPHSGHGSGNFDQLIAGGENGHGADLPAGELAAVRLGDLHLLQRIFQLNNNVDLFHAETGYNETDVGGAVIPKLGFLCPVIFCIINDRVETLEGSGQVVGTADFFISAAGTLGVKQNFTLSAAVVHIEQYAVNGDPFINRDLQSLIGVAAGLLPGAGVVQFSLAV